jgi:hypothetical protein
MTCQFSSVAVGVRVAVGGAVGVLGIGLGVGVGVGANSGRPQLISRIANMRKVNKSCFFIRLLAA